MTCAIVHIGFNKCGSTALQKWLANNRAALLREGYAYRRTDPRDNVVCTNPQFLALALTQAGQPLWPRRMNDVLGIDLSDPESQQHVAMEFAADYLQWMPKQNAHSVLISSEVLGPRLNTPELVAGLDNWLRENFESTRYVAYIREPEAWTVSQFGHTMRRRQVENDLKAIARRGARTTFGRSLRAWMDVVGPDRLDLRLFEERWLSGHGLVEDYCDCTGIDPVKVPIGATLENRSFMHGGLMGRLRPERNFMKRPKPAPDVTRMVRDTNAKDMSWIEAAFFGGRESQFRAWLAGQATT